MVFVNDNQLEQLEFLLDQSAQGLHHIFDGATLVRTLKAAPPLEFTAAEVNRVQRLLNRLVVQPTIAMKMAWVSRLTMEEKDLLVRSYFNIVENNIYDAQEDLH